jgi:TrmH family RNA methyltransferase
VKVIHVADEVLASLAGTSTPQGVVAVVEIRSLDLAALPADADLVVILADVRDPGNAGTILRSSLAAGADAAVFGTGSVDPYHPKTVRSGAGALFRLPVVRGLETPAAIEALKASGFRVVGADASADVSYTNVDMTGPVAIVLGNEAWGLPAETAALLDRSVSIPMPGPAESLNVGIAGALLLFEAVRQRGDG